MDRLEAAITWHRCMRRTLHYLAHHNNLFRLKAMNWDQDNQLLVKGDMDLRTPRIVAESLL